MEHKTAPPYSEKDLKILTEMFLAGETGRAIGARLGRSKQSVWKKIHDMQLRQERDKDVKRRMALVADTAERNLQTVNDGHEQFMAIVSDESGAAMVKAFTQARTAASSQDLNAALGAAQKAIQLYRQANGLDMAGSGNTFNFYMQQAKDSPLDRASKAKPVEVVAE